MAGAIEWYWIQFLHELSFQAAIKPIDHENLLIYLPSAVLAEWRNNSFDVHVS